MSKKTVIFLFSILFFTPIVRADDISVYRNLGYVVVSPNGPTDGGDYGPNTAGTQTSGLQEAFNYGRDNAKNVFVIGGPDVVYNVGATLTVYWEHSMQIRGSNYTMNFSITNGDCLVFDSQMSAEYQFGRIAAPNLQSGTVVRIKPTTVGPDNFAVFTTSIIEFDAIIGGGSESQGVFDGKGIGLYLDSAQAAVLNNKISVMEISGCQTGLLLGSPSAGLIFNQIDCPLISNCDTMIQVETGAYTIINAAMQPHPNAVNTIGANIAAGEESMYFLSWLDGYDPGDSLIFGAASRDNLVYAMNLPVDGITHNSSNPTNRVVPFKPVGFNVVTPPVPALNQDATNNTGYSVIVTILTPGTVSNWTIKDSDGIAKTVYSSVYAGQSFYLDAGDKIGFTYSNPPTWVWRALR